MNRKRIKKIAAVGILALGLSAINIHFSNLRKELDQYKEKALQGTWSDVSYNAPYLDAKDATIRTGAECAELYGYSPLIRSCLRRGYKAESEGGFCFSGPEGILYECHPLIKARISNLHTILVLGGSTSATGYSLYLEQLLNEAASKEETNERFNVINLALSGYRSIDNLLSYKKFIEFTHGKIPFEGVTILAGWNDIASGELFSEKEHESITYFNETGDLSAIKRLGGWFETSEALDLFVKQRSLDTPNSNRYARSALRHGFVPRPYYENLREIFKDAKMRGAFTAIELPPDAYDCGKPVAFFGARNDILIGAADARAIIRDGIPLAAQRLRAELGTIIIDHPSYFNKDGVTKNCNLFGWIDTGEPLKGDELHMNENGQKYQAISTFNAIRHYYFKEE